MDTDFKQCSCGMFFPAPWSTDHHFRQHLRTGQHARATRLEICGPCFFGACSACDGRRGTTTWKCRCAHEDVLMLRPDTDRLKEMHADWSMWLYAGCPGTST